MRTAKEIWLLGRDSLRLWWRFGPQLGIWFCLGLLVRELGLFGSIWLSGRRFEAGIGEGSALFWAYRSAETLVFIAGMIGWVIALVLMIAATRPGLPAVATGRLPDVVVGGIAPAARRRDLLLDAVPAFLAVFAVGGFAEEQVFALFQANLSTWGGRFQSFSVTLADWRFYAVLTVLAGLLGLGLRPILRGQALAGAAAQFALKSITVLAGFLGLGGLLNASTNWLMTRRLWQWGRRGWETLLDRLPDWTLWSELTIPEAIRAAADFLWHSVLPGMVDSVALPLLWLALTATVFGWYDFRHGVAATEREKSVLDASRRLVGTQGGITPWRLGRRWLLNQAQDYLPTLQALRLILRAGIRFAGAFVVVMTLVAAAQTWLSHGADLLIGPLTDRGAAFAASLYSLLELPTRTLWVAVLACAFDRAIQVLSAPEGIEAIGLDRAGGNDQGLIRTAQEGS